jgi:predicted ATPase
MEATMTTGSKPCSDTAAASTQPARLIVLEGMPGAGKTTAASALAVLGHVIVGEYTDDTSTTLAISAHPHVGDDDAHQRNWLRKANQCAALLVRNPVVFADRDWLSSLSYAFSTAPADGGALLSQRATWAAAHLNDGTLLLPGAYAIFDLDPSASLARRASRLRPGHPWNQPGALDRLREFYRDPAAALRPVSGQLAAALITPARISVPGQGNPDNVLALVASLAST